MAVIESGVWSPLLGRTWGYAICLSVRARMHASMLNMQLALQVCVLADMHAAGLIFSP